MSLLSLKVQIAGDTWIHGKPSLFSTQHPYPNHGEQQAAIFVWHTAVVLVYTKASGTVTRLQESSRLVNFCCAPFLWDFLNLDLLMIAPLCREPLPQPSPQTSPVALWTLKPSLLHVGSTSCSNGPQGVNNFVRDFDNLELSQIRKTCFLFSYSKYWILYLHFPVK